MTDTIIVRESGALVGNFEFHRKGLVVNGSPSFEEWAEVYKALETMAGAIQLWMGDLLNYGEQAYGEKYSQFLDTRAYGTLATWAWVARKVDFYTRSEQLPFEHHRKVAPLPPPEQERLLREAEKKGWSSSRLGEEVRATRGDPPPRRLYEGEGVLQFDDDGWAVRLPVNVDVEGETGDVVTMIVKST
ncbi:MAG: hypothetical protein ABIH46_10710 [Chloroflexota bacterium]